MFRVGSLVYELHVHTQALVLPSWIRGSSKTSRMEPRAAGLARGAILNLIGKSLG